MTTVILGIRRRIWCHISAIIFGLSVVTPLTFMSLDRADPVTIISTTVSGDIVPGGTISIVWEAFSSRPCTGDARSWIVGTNKVVHDYSPRPTVIRSTIAERGTYSVEVTLPNSLPPGPAMRTTYVRYFCNPLQNWLNWPITATRVIYFDVKPKPERA
jgi:hypothetical protein